MKDKKEVIVVEKELPPIVCSEKLISPSGQELQSNYVEVKGHTLDESYKMIKKIKKEFQK